MNSSQKVAAPPWAVAVSSALGMGYSPIASGTVASFAVAIIAFLAPDQSTLTTFLWIAATFLSTTVGIKAIALVQPKWGKDPSKVVIDEVAGMCLVFCTPLATDGVYWILASFLLFRMYDIVKPFPINWLDARSEAWSVMADDLLAGVFTVVTIYIWQAVLSFFILSSLT